jgi:two-component sensor histidine kinase
VKNNLQQINALLRIESDTLTDTDAKASFLAMSERIQALGTVHRLLISSSQPSRCDTAEFLAELCDGLAASRGAPGAAIRIEVNADHWEVPIDEAITLGLLVNELVANALKHAFEGRSDGRVVVGYLIQPNADALLTVVDDGSGMPASEGWPSDGAGGRIIRGLVTQLRGTISVRAAAGRTRGAIIEVRLPRSDQE